MQFFSIMTKLAKNQGKTYCCLTLPRDLPSEVVTKISSMHGGQPMPSAQWNGLVKCKISFPRWLTTLFSKERTF